MGVTYADSGVDIIEENSTISLFTEILERTFSQRDGREGEVVPGKGHFAHCIKLGDKYAVLATDGVGTKVLVAQLTSKYNTVGIDMIAMNVNDLICVGAEPLALVDYLACESHDEEMMAQLAQGLAEGAKQAGIAIIGGETATLKGVVTGIDGKGFDLAGTCLGIVTPDKMITGEKMRPGDTIVGLASSGIHSNGLTLARKVLLGEDPAAELEKPFAQHTLAEELLMPTRIYVRPVLEMLAADLQLHGMFHITGSGFRKLFRLRTDLGFMITDLLPIPPIFAAIKERGQISDQEMFSTFNMGMGFAIITPQPEEVIEICQKHGVEAHVVGVVDGSSEITITQKGIIYSPEGMS